jgi:hypothetical protein
MSLLKKLGGAPPPRGVFGVAKLFVLFGESSPCSKNALLLSEALRLPLRILSFNIVEAAALSSLFTLSRRNLSTYIVIGALFLKCGGSI